MRSMNQTNTVRNQGKNQCKSNGNLRSSNNRSTRCIVLSVFVLIVLVTLATNSCQSANPAETENQSSAKLFQQAYEATDAGDYEKALSIYQSYKDLFPNDLGGNLWALYEIAFIHHKKGDDKTAIALFEELLKKYEVEGASSWPKAQKILTERVLRDLKQKVPQENK